MFGLFKKPLNIELLARDLSENLATECPVLEICRNAGAKDEKSNLEYLCLDYYFASLAVESKIKNKNESYKIQKLVSELVKDLFPKDFDLLQRCKDYASVRKKSKPDILFYMIGEQYAKFIGVPNSIPVAVSVGVDIGHRAIALTEFLEKIQKSYKLVQL